MNLFWNRPLIKPIYDNLSEVNKERFTRYKPWTFWWLAFVNKWKGKNQRTIRQNQGILD